MGGIHKSTQRHGMYAQLEARHAWIPAARTTGNATWSDAWDAELEARDGWVSAFSSDTGTASKAVPVTSCRFTRDERNANSAAARHAYSTCSAGGRSSRSARS